jgi:coenzyme F420-0:L-glutamate ligase/coenzyme F420-1:gamma-L-glutamate ligase
LIEIIPVRGVPEVRPGDDLVALVGAAVETDIGPLHHGDILVIASKLLSKAEGRQVLDLPEPGPRAQELAAITGIPASDVELILSQSRTVLRSAPGVLVVETEHGFVCANAGVDHSNSGGNPLRLPEAPDQSAQELREGLVGRFGVDVAVLVSDTFGRPFRLGQVNVAIGVAGMRPLRDYRGKVDPHGYHLQGTEIAVADELCAAAELVMNKLDRVPVAVIRGYEFELNSESNGRELLRNPAQDYFR